MKKSLKVLSSYPIESLPFRFFKRSGLRFKSTMILPVRSELFEQVHLFDELKYNTQNSRQLFHENLVKILEKGLEKFNQGKYKESETNFDQVINSFAGFETDDLTINERRLISTALTRKAEITTKFVPSSSWDVALAYAKMAVELDQNSEHADEIYLSIKSELSMNLSGPIFESSSNQASSHN